MKERQVFSNIWVFKDWCRASAHRPTEFFLTLICIPDLTLFTHSEWVSKFSFSGIGDLSICDLSIGGISWFWLFCFSQFNIYHVFFFSVRSMVFNATFNNISAISWRSVFLWKENGVSGENHRPTASHWQILSHNVVSSTPRHEWNSCYDLEMVLYTMDTIYSLYL